MFIKTFNGQKNVTGIVIKNARERKKMTKKELSKTLELYGVYIHRNELLLIEQNKLMVKDFELLAISKVLDIDLNDLKSHFNNN